MQREEIVMVDRIEEERFAVLLADASGEEFVIDTDRLPAGAKEGSYLTALITDDEISGLAVHVSATDLMHAEVAEKLRRVRSRSKRSRFKRE